jgi:glyoxylase-like metal-dependent hydrolase (beta-lactamase superfamily II)
MMKDMDRSVYRLDADIHPLADGDMILGCKVMEFPGHSPDHIGLLQEREGIFFGGDVVVGHLDIVTLFEPEMGGERGPVLRQYLNALNTCMNLHITALFPGHGDPIAERDRFQEIVKQKIRHIEQLSEAIRGALGSSRRPMTGREIAGQVFASQKVDFVRMMELISHLDWLESSGTIVKEKHNGLYYFSSKADGGKQC